VARRGLDRAQVIEAAATLADRDGLESVTLGRLAGELGVRPPSLYNHVDGLDGVLRGWDLEGDDAIHAVRVVRSALHGFVALELSGGFGLPLDLDDSYERLVGVLAEGL
jgi:AcrR family transcriptional regulator